MIRGSAPEDEFESYFSQYRPRQPSQGGGDASPAPSTYHSAHSSLGRAWPESLTETQSNTGSYHTFNRSRSTFRSSMYDV